MRKFMIMKIMPACMLSIFITLLGVNASAENLVFRFNLFAEPTSANPHKNETGNAGYLFTVVNEGLFRYENGKPLLERGAKSCIWKTDFELICELNEKVKWSDGTPVKAQDYVYSFQDLINPETKSRDSEHILRLLNAKQILKGEKKPTELGVTALGDYKLRFQFEERDVEFLLRLTHPALVPVKVGTKLGGPEDSYARERVRDLPVNGPYKFGEWVKGKKIILEPNPQYAFGHSERPLVEVLFITDDSPALTLYENGTLSLMRRLDRAQIEKYKNRKDLKDIAVLRFDYFGLSQNFEPFKNKNIRRAFAEGLDYNNSQALFQSVGRFGCAGIPPRLASDKHCLNFKEHTLSTETKEKLEKLKKGPGIQFIVSEQGGETVRKMAEWVQAQWDKNLGVHVEIQTREQKMFSAMLKSNPPPVFRRGINLDRPTCLAALEVFETGAPDNFVKFSNKEYDSILKQLRQKQMAEPARKKLCERALEIMIKDENAIIPTGRYDFTMLINPKAQGVNINELNHLDLSQLHWVEQK